MNTTRHTSWFRLFVFCLISAAALALCAGIADAGDPPGARVFDSNYPIFAPHPLDFTYDTRRDFNENGSVDIGDVTYVAYNVVGLFQAYDPATDLNNQSGPDVGDAAKIAWYYVGKIPEL
jgi:hypothetical protein